jgi:nucleotide-binding universal stress UspA family protein
MSVFLIPVDGSPFSARAVDYVIARIRQNPGDHAVHVITAQMPLVGVNIKLFVSAESLQTYYREEGQKILSPVLETLRQAGISAASHLEVGDAAQVIIEASKAIKATEIVMGSHGRGALAGALMGSVAQKVVHLSKIPVILLK